MSRFLLIYFVFKKGFDSVKLTEIGSSNDWDTSTTAEQTINNGDDQGLDVKLEVSSQFCRSTYNMNTVTF